MTAVPAPVSADDVALLSAGLTQRVRALSAVLADARGARRAVAEGVLSRSTLVGACGDDHAHGTPGATVALPLAAFDLDRGPDGRWRVVASHVGPSPAWPVHHRAGAHLADLLDPAPPTGGPGTPSARDVAAPAAAPAPVAAPSGGLRLADVLSACSPGSTAVLLAPAPDEGGRDPWAATALAHGVPLVRAGDLVVTAGRLLVRTTSGPAPVGVVLRALRDDQLDPVVDDAGAAHGCPGLLTAVRAGSAVLAPALGAALVDDAGVRRRTPDLVRWALDEEPLLAEAHVSDGPLLRLVTLHDGAAVTVVPGSLDGALDDDGALGADAVERPGPAPDLAVRGAGVRGAGAQDAGALWRGSGRPTLIPPPTGATAPVVDLRGRVLVGERC